jgi:hypothetical protein
VAAVERPHPTPDRRTIVPQFAAAAAVAFVVKRAARDCAISVHDQRTGTRCHARKGNGRLRRETAVRGYGVA